jgi:peptidyl-prolyl cis-trans isomerase B (cyclophilin B)
MKHLSAILLLLLALGAPALSFAQKAKKEKPVKPDVIITTNLGEIKIKLYEDTPLHRENFLKLARAGQYDSTLFHRIIKEFMIQGGDPWSKDPAKKNLAGQGGPGYTLPAEILPNHFHKKGVLAAARLGDQVNPKRESSGSQFYIVQGKTFTSEELDRIEKQLQMATGNKEFKLSAEARAAYTTVGGTPHLDQQYTVFGEVIEGLDVVDKIAAVKTLSGDRPAEDVWMTMKVLVKDKKPKKKK